MLYCWLLRALCTGHGFQLILASHGPIENSKLIPVKPPPLVPVSLGVINSCLLCLFSFYKREPSPPGLAAVNGLHDLFRCDLTLISRGRSTQIFPVCNLHRRWISQMWCPAHDQGQFKWVAPWWHFYPGETGLNSKCAWLLQILETKEKTGLKLEKSVQGGPAQTAGT